MYQNVVVLDTSSDLLGVSVARLVQAEGVFTDYKVLSCKDHPCRRKANVELTNTIKEALAEATLTSDDIDCVLVGRGPGSFTGVRIGIATAKGLAAGARCPLYGASTLDSYAFSAWKSGVRGMLGVVADAMRKEVYPGIYELSDTGITRRFTAEIVQKVPACIESWADLKDRLTLTGDGLFKYADAFKEAGFERFAQEDAWWPASEGLLYALTTSSLAQVQAGDPALVLPVYTRLSDAEEDERKKLGLAQTKETTGVAEGMANIHLQLRPLSINDVDQVVALERDVFEGSFHKPCTKEDFIAAQANTQGSWWVAHDMGRIVAFAGGRATADRFEIEDVCVASDRRREGIATRLIARIAYDAQMLNCPEISLEVAAENTSAQALYTSLGFEEVGRRKNYYANGDTALVMTAQLPLTCDIQKTGDVPEPRASKRSWLSELPQRSQCEEDVIQSQGALILAIESSCDETAMAIINERGEILSSVIATQIDFHARFGGVVPEIASRKHTEALIGVFEETLEQTAGTLGVSYLAASDLAAVAVTQGPGLVGALVVGVAFAKGLCCACNLPLIGVNHLEGHLFANLFETPDLEPPFVASLISGGNTMLVHVRSWGDYEILGATIDDAVGEAFDKVAKALGLGYPGGPVISRLAQQGNPKAITFPRAMMHSHDYRFSLSGLKTSVITYINNENQAGRPINLYDLAASFEAAVIDVQVAKAKTAVLECGVKDFCAGGGVTANPSLRAGYRSALEPLGVRVTVPPMGVCTDNAAMIALVALQNYKQGKFEELTMDANPNLALAHKE